MGSSGGFSGIIIIDLALVIEIFSNVIVPVLDRDGPGRVVLSISFSGIRLVLYGEASIPYEACISSCNKFNHCPIVGVFSSLMKEDLRPAMINLSNQVVSQAIS